MRIQDILGGIDRRFNDHQPQTADVTIRRALAGADEIVSMTISLKQLM